MTRTRSTFLALIAALLSPVAANADVISLEATINGAQANAGLGTGSTATGFAAVTFDDVSNVFSWDVSWSGLLGDLTVAHFHGPATPAQNAGVQVNFLGIAPGNPSVGSTFISNLQAADLLAGLWYVNIHSTVNPAGEIRGQVLRVAQNVPEPGTLALFGIGLLGMVAARRKKKA